MVDDSTDAVDEIEAAWRRERPGTPAGSIAVLTRIRRIAKLLDDDRRQTLTRLGVDAATLDLLATLRRAGPPYRLSPGEIARQTLVSAGAISQRIARAERTGLVERLRSQEDGRAAVIALTPSGHALVERTVDELLHHEETLLTGLSKAERRQLADLLRTLLAHLSGSRIGTARRPDSSGRRGNPAQGHRR